MGWWVHHLPVTTEVALRAGRSLWGYPKFLADIGYEWDGPRRICTLAAEGSEILRVVVDTRLPASIKPSVTTFDSTAFMIAVFTTIACYPSSVSTSKLSQNDY